MIEEYKKYPIFTEATKGKWPYYILLAWVFVVLIPFVGCQIVSSPIRVSSYTLILTSTIHLYSYMFKSQPFFRSVKKDGFTEKYWSRIIGLNFSNIVIFFSGIWCRILAELGFYDGIPAITNFFN